MPKAADDVDGFMAKLEHPRKDEIEELRAAILATGDHAVKR